MVSDRACSSRCHTSIRKLSSAVFAIASPASAIDAEPRSFAAPDHAEIRNIFLSSKGALDSVFSFCSLSAELAIGGEPWNFA